MKTISGLSALLYIGFSYSKRGKDRDKFFLSQIEYVYNLIFYKWHIYVSYLYCYYQSFEFRSISAGMTRIFHSGALFGAVGPPFRSASNSCPFRPVPVFGWNSSVLAENGVPVRKLTSIKYNEILAKLNALFSQFTLLVALNSSQSLRACLSGLQSHFYCHSPLSPSLHLTLPHGCSTLYHFSSLALSIS